MKPPLPWKPLECAEHRWVKMVDDDCKDTMGTRDSSVVLWRCSDCHGDWILDWDIESRKVMLHRWQHLEDLKSQLEIMQRKQWISLFLG